MPGSRVGVRGRRALAVIVVALVLAGVVAAAVAIRRPESPESRHDVGVHQVASPVPRRETRPTLDPGGFTGEVAAAYQVAREIPDVLDQLHCHCNCHSQYGHASLLSCYTDGHAST